MEKKRGSLIVFGVIAILGVVAAIVGLALGGRFGWYHVSGGKLVFENRTETVDVADVPDWVPENLNILWGGWLTNGDYDGEIIEGGGEHTEEYDIFEEGELEKLVIDIPLGYVEIRTGTDYGLVTYGPMQADSSFNNGTWEVKADDVDGSITTRQVAGRTHFFQGGEDVTTTYIFTVPVAFTELNVTMNMGAGVIEGINLNKLYAYCAMNSLDINNVNVTESELGVDMGLMELNNFYGTITDITCNMGSVELAGSITSEVVINCDMGNVQINLPEPDGYSYSVDVDMGHVALDGKQFVLKDESGQEDGDGPYFDIQCGMGNVEVNFR